MGDRGTCWSITINNPGVDDTKCEVPGWKLEGQFEVGEEGTPHFQGCLRTPQVRFSAVKRAFPRAHIEVARDRVALQRYVHKEDTRVAAYVPDDIPSMFRLQEMVAAKWDPQVWDEWWEAAFNRPVTASSRPPDIDEEAMKYLDVIVAGMIEAGQRGAEFIAINPMWRSSWKRFWRSIITRHAQVQRHQETPQPPPEEGTQE